MGVYIKNMEMPTSCWDCEVGGAKQMDNATCPFYAMEFWEQENYQDKIADGCPLVPVPPHGRLIDADALKLEIAREDDGFGHDVYTAGIHDGFALSFECIDEAPTIIPTEEGET